MKSAFLFLGLLFGLQSAHTQKLIRKSLVDQKISHIQVDAKNCFELDLSTSEGDELLVEAQIDGEYEKDLLLQILEEGSTIKISAGFQPNFVNPNDKLSAHKVVSIALNIVVPAQKNIHVFGSNCNVVVTGTYDFLKVSLNDGRCDLKNTRGTVEVITQSGHISAIYNDVVVRAISKYGKVRGKSPKNGNGHYSLSTVTGDIHLRRVE